MNITKLLLLPITVATFGSSVYATPTGEELVKANCASCHTLDMPSPQTMPTFKAPAMEAVLFHVKDAMKDDNKKVKDFIVDYAQNPMRSKTVCESDKVQKFGLMPSLKGKVSPEDLATIADHLIETYPTKGFVTMLTKMLTNDKMNTLKNSPFLMNQDALPHLTKILIENWDKGTLGLTAEQKEKLLVVRTETMTGVKKIKDALNVLETEIIEMTVDDEALKTIQPKVEEVAKLKAQATMIQLKCLKDSLKILNDEQVELLLPFWGV
ncbi:c-type cytochrome [bacterium]|nr:c-type cytochrome [bacterium]MBU1958204.1 c-type cytochrome [bacterium]